MTIDEIKKYLFTDLPMPSGCQYYGEGGYPHQFPGGLAIRRTVIVDVSGRLPSNAPRFGDTDSDPDTVHFYEKFTETLIDDFYRVIEVVCTERGEKTPLGGPDEKDTFVYFSSEFAITIRGSFDEYHCGRPIWNIDYVAVITPKNS